MRKNLPVSLLGSILLCCAVTAAATAPRDEGALRAAVTAPMAGAYATIVIARPLSLTADLVVPAQVALRFEDGGCLTISAGRELLIQGSVEAPLQPIFTGPGRVQFVAGRVREVYPQWWGACGDGRHDDTPALRAAIRALPLPIPDVAPGEPMSGGTVYLSPGRYLVTGTVEVVTGLSLRGAGPQASVILYASTTGSCLKMPPDCANFTVEDLALRARGDNSAVGIDGTTPYVRYFRMNRFTVTGFHTGVYIREGLHLSLSNGYIGCFGRGETNGSVGLKLGDRAEKKSCTTASVYDVYFTNAETCMYNYAAPCLLSRPIFETCALGLDSYSRAVVLEPFFAECRVDARLTDNGALFVGPFPTEYKIEYADATTRNRTSFLPDTFDTLMKLGRMELPAQGDLTLDGQPVAK